MRRMPIVIALVTPWLLLGCGEERVSQQTVSMTAPRAVTINPGAETVASISVNRENFSDPIRLKMSNLPEGITVSKSIQNEIILSEDARTADFTLSASTMVDPVENHQITVTAHAEGLPTITETIALTVTE